MKKHSLEYPDHSDRGITETDIAMILFIYLFILPVRELNLCFQPRATGMLLCRYEQMN
jgi:hypothetical protein